MLAEDGQQAVDFLLASPQAIDVVVMDVQMPVLDGHDATRRIRQELHLLDLPIIALTAGALSSERQRATAAGMNDYLLKPLDAQALVGSILRRVKKDSQRLARIVDSAIVDPRVSPEWHEIDGIDGADARTRLSDDFELFWKMLQLLLADFAEPRFGELVVEPAALSQRANLMHKLRGTAGTLGAVELHALADRAQKACVAGDVDEVAAIDRSIAASLERLRAGVARCTSHRSAMDGDEPDDGNDLDPKELAAFVDLLRRQSLSATDLFERMAGSLQRRLGAARYAVLRAHIDRLEFDDAADTIEAGRPH